MSQWKHIFTYKNGLHITYSLVSLALATARPGLSLKSISPELGRASMEPKKQFQKLIRGAPTAPGFFVAVFSSPTQLTGYQRLFSWGVRHVPLPEQASMAGSHLLFSNRVWTKIYFLQSIKEQPWTWYHPSTAHKPSWSRVLGCRQGQAGTGPDSFGQPTTKVGALFLTSPWITRKLPCLITHNL